MINNYGSKARGARHIYDNKRYQGLPTPLSLQSTAVALHWYASRVKGVRT